VHDLRFLWREEHLLDNRTTIEREAQQPLLAYQVFILLASVFSLAVMGAMTVIKVSPSTETILETADGVVCGLFLVDFAVSLVRAKNRTRYMLAWGWLDLLSAIPAVDVARWGRAARIVRVLRVLRVLRATRSMAMLAYEHRARNAALAGVLLLLLIVFASSIAILHFEDTEGGNIRNGHDAMWWAATTVSTVGYGDFYPVTWEGRLIAVLLMITGVGAFAAMAGGLASWFLAPPKESDIASMVAELRSLRSAVDRLSHGGKEGRDGYSTETLPSHPMDGSSASRLSSRTQAKR